jgi:hypothetical protein
LGTAMLLSIAATKRDHKAGSSKHK